MLHQYFKLICIFYSLIPISIVVYAAIKYKVWHKNSRPFSSREYQPLVADIPVAYVSS